MSGEQAEERTAREGRCASCGLDREHDLHNASAELLACSSFTADDYHVFYPMPDYAYPSACPECSRLASRVEELEKLIAKQSLSPEISSTQLDTGKEK